MGTAVLIGLAVVALFAAGYALHHLALWMEDRGWIFYRTKGMAQGSAASAAMEIASMLEPEVGHVIEEIRSEQLRAEQDESGEGLL